MSSNLHVATKFAAYPWRITPGNIVAACKGSLRRTGLEAISLGQLHWSAAKYAPLQEWALWNGLADCYEQGLVSAVGVSNYGAKELRRVARDFEKRGVPLASAQVGGSAPAPPSVCQQQGPGSCASGSNPAVCCPPQVQYSLLSCGAAQSSIKAVADDLGIVLIAYSPLALGLLTGGGRGLLGGGIWGQLVSSCGAVQRTRPVSPKHQVAVPCHSMSCLLCPQANTAWTSCQPGHVAACSGSCCLALSRCWPHWRLSLTAGARACHR